MSSLPTSLSATSPLRNIVRHVAEHQEVKTKNWFPEMSGPPMKCWSICTVSGIIVHFSDNSVLLIFADFVPEKVGHCRSPQLSVKRRARFFGLYMR